MFKLIKVNKKIGWFKGSDEANESPKEESNVNHMNAKLKWNYVVEKVKEEKYNIGQKCTSCTTQIKEKSENIGATVKMQAKFKNTYTVRWDDLDKTTQPFNKTSCFSSSEYIFH